MKNNLDELVRLVKWVKKEQLDGITFQPIAAAEFFGGKKKYKDDWYLKSDLWPEKNDVFTLIDKLEDLKKAGYPIANSRNDFRRFRSYFENPIKFANKENCESELSSVVITKDGKMKMCPALTEDFGSFLEDDLDKMWKSMAANRARKHVYGCKSQCKILANNKEDFYF